MQLNNDCAQLYATYSCRKSDSMENECEALPGVAYPGVLDNRSTLNTKTGYDDDDECVSYI